MASLLGVEQNISMAMKARPHPKKTKQRHFIKEWRKHRGLTQEQLAERTGFSPGTISQLETGRINYVQSTLEQIAEALQCEPGDLLMRNPLDTDAVWSIWEGLDLPSKQKAMAEILQTMPNQKTGTGH